MKTDLIIGLIIFLVFYGSYFAKMLTQEAAELKQTEWAGEVNQKELLS